MGLPDDPEVNQVQDNKSIDYYSPLFFKTRAFLMSLENKSNPYIYRGRP